MQDPFHSRPRLLEVAQVAHRLNMGEAFVRRLIRAGTLPAYRIGKQLRVAEPDLDTYMEAQRVRVATLEQAIAHGERDLDRRLDVATDRVRALRSAG